ncbi:MAG: hypothetical protein SGBAC_001766 [Bacillariaceae sp.]
MKVIFNIFAIILLVETVAGQSCSLCPDGSSAIVDPNAKLGTSTCGKVESDLSRIPNAACTAMTLSVNFYFDYSAFCCSDVPTPERETCDVCKPGYIIMQDEIQTPGNNLVGTCGETKIAAFYAEAGPACNILQEAALSCCEKAPPTESPTKNPTTSPTASPTKSPAPTEAPVAQPVAPPVAVNAVEGQQAQGAESGAASRSMMFLGAVGLVLSWIVLRHRNNSTDNKMKTALYFLACALLLNGAAAQCSLCPGGSSSIGSSNAALLPGTTDASCGEKEDLAAAASDADCDSVVESINAGIDYSAFCCGDVQPDSNSCKFCDGISIDVNQEFPPDFSNSVTTCGQAKTLTQYISANDGACETIVNIGIESCCLAPTMPPTKVPTVTRPPTPYPTPQPTPTNPTRRPTTAPVTPVTTSGVNQMSMATLVILGVSALILQA